MKLAKVTRGRDAFEQHTQAKRNDVTRPARMKLTNAHQE
jgi:hypothetical protein